MTDDNTLQANAALDQARQAWTAGDLHTAVTAAGHALEHDDQTSGAYEILALVHLKLCNYDMATLAIREALAVDPAAAILHLRHARILWAAGSDLPTALAAAEQAVRLDPEIPGGLASVIGLLQLLGRYDEAAARLLPALERYPHDIAIGIAFADLAERLGQVEAAIDRLRRHLPQSGTNAALRAEILFRLGHLYDLTGNTDPAFESIQAANDARGTDFDPTAFEHSVEAVIRNWTADFLASTHRADNDSQRVVLIVGMPRSGTSVVEQILASHPEVFGGGELQHLPQNAVADSGGRFPDSIPFADDNERLDPALIDRIGNNYLQEIATLSPAKTRVTDKNPFNLLLLGLAQLALPKVRVIHCSRDPRDSCLSCYFSDFQPDNQIAHKLTHLGIYYRATHRLMQHWRTVLDLPLLDVSYEDLVDDVEGQARRMLEFLGLDWNESCLDFHASRRIVMTGSAMQVRKPVYRSSVGRHRRYRKHLGELFAALDGN